ncbi:MAG: MoxR family ATPase [Myxococcota bacterium]|nr:MoxR family ATPase [Myxococcota bacterium]
MSNKIDADPLTPSALIDAFAPRLEQAVTAVSGVIRGKESTIEDALTALISGGHILLEDVPGVGKTTLARALATVLGVSFKRIQFTNDLLPSDILGVHIYKKEDESFDFRPGPIFSHLILADEINRTTPKTQSSLLEAMNERQVSIDNETRPLPRPFMVIATQNPQDFQGTYPLPESQLDRFMLRLSMGYPAEKIERAILQRRQHLDPVKNVSALLDAHQLSQIQQGLDGIRVDESVLDYILAIVQRSRTHTELSIGVSTRGALELQQAARGRALLRGRDYVIPDDVKHLAASALAHRVHLTGRNYSADRRGQTKAIIQEIVEQVAVPL